MGILALIGRTAISIFDILGGLTLMFKSSVYWLLRPPYRKGVIIDQMESIGVKSLPVVVLSGFFIGMVFAYQCYYGFSMFGAEAMVGSIVALGMARELGPVLSAIMVTARSGSSMAAELGTMRVTEQVDAMYALAVEPMQYLVAPRILAGIVMMPILNFFSVLSGIVGGYIICVKFLGVNATLYIQNSIQYLAMGDIFNGTVKAMTFGLILSLVGCYKGFYATGGALGVGKATTEAVVLACLLILLFDYLLTALMF